jgi:predicted MPP superfamily phosphohydrolase
MATGLYWRGVSNAAKVEVKHNSIPSPDLPASFDGFIILQLSDLHVDMSETEWNSWSGCSETYATMFAS